MHLMRRRGTIFSLSPITVIAMSWNLMAASMALTRSSNVLGTSAESVTAMRSSRCSRRAPSSGL